MRNPWLRRRVLAYAHQGGALEGPSSTLFAMRRALEAGATALELDVHATADRQLVVCHDAEVDRMTDGSGRVSEMTLAEVRELDAAYWFVPGLGVPHDRPPGDYPMRGRGPADPELRVPTLEEVLDAFPGVVLNLDIKQTAPEVEPYEQELARLLHRWGRTDDVIVASFSDDATRVFHRFAPDVAISPGVRVAQEIWLAMREGAEPGRFPHSALQVPPDLRGVPVVEREFVGRAHEMGLAVHVWTVDDPAEMERMVSLGVDGIMTDRPSVLARVLADLGAGWPPSTAAMG
jgi:glycerophosphoryl diester phosphodiesterase